jgi:hypothetical protein
MAKYYIIQLNETLNAYKQAYICFHQDLDYTIIFYKTIVRSLKKNY